MPKDGLKRAKNYIAERNKFIHWLASPELQRTPTTQGALAKELGVHEVTLSSWKTPEFMAKVNALVDEHLSYDYAMAVDSMKRQVRQGSFPHTKMYFEMIGKYVPKSEISGPGGTPLIPQVKEVREHLNGSSSSTDTEPTNEPMDGRQ